MFSQRTAVRAGALMLCAALMAPAASAGEAALCFSPADFGTGLSGICITAVPGEGALCLGDRVIRSGDVLTAGQLALLTFAPEQAESDRTAAIRYLPLGAEGLGPETELVIAIRGRKNAAPVAGDSKLETYKNLPNEGLLNVSDPEGDALTFTLTRAPRRGEVILREDGSFLYTPKKNKVGTDSFTYTATDASGNVSQEATVTVEILRPSDDRQYADTASSDCRFEAEWLRSSGIFAGETVSGRLCFSPDEPVSRGQFLAMLMEVLELPVDRGAEQTGFLDGAPDWLKPYLAAAMRSGIVSGYPAGEGVEFRPDQSVTAAEAAAMVRRAMDFAVPAASMDIPAFGPAGSTPLTRADAARALYRVSLARREHLAFPDLAR